jgi:hypothetical protein
MKINPKIVAGISSVVIAASAGLLYYTNTQQDTGDILGWYSSSWLYRRSTTVGNSTGSTLTNEDVLISYDTASLVSAGKLQSDCDDLRFTDSDEVTVINYWIEGGCNTSTTQIWVRIPSLPNGGKTIYMYYGNDTATAGEQTWSNNFVALSDQTTCATGWTQISDLNDRFPRGATSYGGTGGSSSHSHSGSTNTSSQSAYVSALSIAWGTAYARATSHSHSVTYSTTTDSHLPPYENMHYCEKSKLDIPTNHITMFDASTPTGWTRYSSLDNRFPRGATSGFGGSNVGDTGGSATHSHTISFSVGSASHSTYILVAWSPSVNSVLGTSHTHTITDQSISGDNLPPYLNMVFAKKNSSGTLSSEKPIYILDTATMPLGWERFTALDDKFPRGASSYGGTGGSSTHNHTGSATTGNAINTGNVNSGSSQMMPNHTHTLSWSTDSKDTTPPYLDVVFAKRKSSQTTSVGSEETANTAPTAPTSLLTEGQTDPIMITTTTPKFSAIYNDPDTGDTSSYYQIEVNTSSGFDGTTMWDSTKSAMTTTNEGTRSPDITYAGSALTLNSGTTYYWRIKFWDAADAEGTWSSTATFQMNSTPTAPTSLLTEGQTDPIMITTTTPKFSAIYNDPDTGDTSSYYQVQVNTSSDFLGTSVWDSTKSLMTTTNEGTRSPDITYGGSALTLNSGTIYYWRIKFWDAADAESTWSSTATFQMNSTPTAPTSLLTEAETNPNKITTTAPKFSAIFNDPDTNDTSSYYQIQVNTTSGFDGTTMWDSTKSLMTTTNEGDRSPDITYGGSALSLNSGTTYYWKIKFWDAADAESTWSSTGTFQMNSTPTAPTGLLTEGETNPELIVTETPKFSAIFNDPDTNDTSSYYQIQVNTNNTFSGIEMWDSTKSAMTTTNEGTRSPDITYAGLSLTMGFETYYWRIKFWDEADASGPWSETAYFKTSTPRLFLDGLRFDGVRID